MKRSLFNTRGKLLAVLFFVVAALFATTVQNAYAATYTTMDAQGNIIQSESLKDAVALARAKAKKETQQAVEKTEEVTKPTEELDPRKVAVAAPLARAKAKTEAPHAVEKAE